jgi:aminoglycoside phosphotransferase (APT) family kinase protein
VIEVEVEIDQLQSRLAPIGAVGLRRLTGGASSLSYAATATFDGVARQVVVKVAPAGLKPVRNRDVLRQARLLRALTGNDVSVPAVLWEDGGEPPDVPPLFVMSFVEGVSLEPLFDEDGDDDVLVVSARMLEASRVLARLHALDPATLGLEDVPASGPTDEVARWSRALETVDQSLVRGWQVVADRLLATEPAAVASTIVHGDFRLGNMLASGATISAVIDWEIWSIGDPRVDLGWYISRFGREVRDIEWFRALASATWQGRCRRYCNAPLKSLPEHQLSATSAFRARAMWSDTAGSEMRPSLSTDDEVTGT